MENQMKKENTIFLWNFFTSPSNVSTQESNMYFTVPSRKYLYLTYFNIFYNTEKILERFPSYIFRMNLEEKVYYHDTKERHNRRFVTHQWLFQCMYLVIQYTNTVLFCNADCACDILTTLTVNLNFLSKLIFLSRFTAWSSLWIKYMFSCTPRRTIHKMYDCLLYTFFKYLVYSARSR